MFTFLFSVCYYICTMGAGDKWAELYERLKSDNEEAWIELDKVIEKLFWRVKNKSYYIKIPPQDSEDIIAWARFAVLRYVKADALREPGAFGALIARICNTYLHKYVKTKGREVIVEPEKLDQACFPSKVIPGDPLKMVEDKERVEIIHKALLMLDPELRFYLEEYLAIRHDYGFSPFESLTEAAKALGMPMKEFWRKARGALEVFTDILSEWVL